MAIRFTPASLSLTSPQRMEFRAANSRSQNFSVSSQMRPQKRKEDRNRRVWRRRKLVKKDEYLDAKMERIPFLEEQVRIIKESGKIISMDIYKLLLREENRFDFVNEVAAEAKAYVEYNVDEYTTKKAVLEVLSNRMNDAGFPRPDAYTEPDPFVPGPGYLKEEFS